MPPRVRNPAVPPWLQEVILRCLEPAARTRYPSAAHLAFDLGHPDQVQVGRARRGDAATWRTHLRAGSRPPACSTPSPLPAQHRRSADRHGGVPYTGREDATLYSLRQAVNRSLGIRPAPGWPV